ncbi:MAG: methyltransferase domain-containing protein [Phycisphaerae bacterium]
MVDTISGNTETNVRRRYADAAVKVEPQLCCASTEYDDNLLDNVPREVVEVDYGCGDPTRWLQPGDTVLDLGSGSGKVCYLAAQVVGGEGRVVGVDFNEPMLAIARKHQREFAGRIGYDNLSFKKGRIQDLALDLEVLEAWLGDHPVQSADDYLAMQEHAAGLRAAQPMIPSDSIGCIVSNCVLNLVQPADKRQLFAEMYRVLRRGGRCVISDIVSDEAVPAHLQRDPELWSGCISGALREDAFLGAFEEVGFYGIEILERGDRPWHTVEGIEFRSVTVRAFKGKEGPCLDRNQAVIYKGPWKAVVDDDGHTLYRGEPMAVCDKTFNIYTGVPYAADIAAVPPRQDVPLDAAGPFDCRKDSRRTPRQTKGQAYRETIAADTGACCSPDADCC